MNNTIIGVYQVLRDQPISGTMATVVKAKHIITGEIVALKLLKLPSPKYEERFIQEAKLLKKINSENILRVYEISKNDDYLFYSMEYYDKVLTEYLDPLPFTSAKAVIKLSASQKLHILKAIADGINVLHQRQIVHRDIAPNNILINSGTLKIVLCDLGLSKVGDVEMPESEKGNPKLYGAPEQDYSLGNATFASDIYSFGVLAYQFLSGFLPKGNIVRDLKSLITYIPNEISNLITNCINTDSDNRPTSKIVLETFNKYLDSENKIELINDIENTPIPFQLYSFLGKGYLDHRPYEVDEVSFYLKHCSKSFFFYGIACKALEIPEFRRYLDTLDSTSFIILNPNNLDLLEETAAILEKKPNIIKSDIELSIEYLDKLKNVKYFLCDELPEWRVTIADENIGLLRNYKGNRFPFESPMLVLNSGPYLEGLIRYVKNKLKNYFVE